MQNYKQLARFKCPESVDTSHYQPAQSALLIGRQMGGRSQSESCEVLRRLWVTGEGRILELSQCYLSSGEERRRLEEVAVVSLPNVARKRFDTRRLLGETGEHGC